MIHIHTEAKLRSPRDGLDRFVISPVLLGNIKTCAIQLWFGYTSVWRDITLPIVKKLYNILQLASCCTEIMATYHVRRQHTFGTELLFHFFHDSMRIYEF